jgi:hypothetical protein
MSLFLLTGGRFLDPRQDALLEGVDVIPEAGEGWRGSVGARVAYLVLRGRSRSSGRHARRLYFLVADLRPLGAHFRR